MPARPSYAVIGAGIGGLALAGFLARNGVKVRVYEQAKEFQRIGAGIQMSPNAVRVLRALGLEPGLRKLAFYPPAWSHRVWDTGEHLADLTFGAEAEARYGAPYLLMHRGDLHAALFSAVPEELIAREKKLLGIDRNGAGVTLSFADGTSAEADAVIGADGVHSRVREILLGADGTSAEADAVIGADGVHSRVREILLGPEKPKFTGRVAHRTTFPAALMGEFAVDTCTKWWGPDRHIVIYPVRAEREEVYFVTSVPDPTWNVESWSSRGEMGEVLAALAGFHEDVQRLLRACPQVHKWALFERDPLPRWCEGPIALLGDACHPMTPYMAQGAASALEDAAMLSRCIAGADDPAEALSRYEATRHARTSRLQLTSRQNTWGKDTGVDPTWVYGYDVWRAPIAEAGARVS